MARGVRPGVTCLGRFWAKVDTSGGPAACWPWTGAKGISRGRTDYPYGVFTIGRLNGKQVFVRAPRFALVLKTGIEPEGLEACHGDTCITLCCNWHHLRWGTSDENRDDWKRRHGSPHKLSDQDAIRAALDALEREGIL